jgi:hypothetical protein
LEEFIMAGKIAALALVAIFSASAFAAESEFVKVTIQGKLHNNVKERRATIEANGFIYELDFDDNRDLFLNAEKHDRDTVRVTGFLKVLETARGESPRLLVVAREMDFVERPAEVRYERREVIEEPVRVYRDEPVRERRVIVRERRDDNLLKVGPLEINKP